MSTIDFDDLDNLPDTRTVTNYQCGGSNYSLINGSVLNSVYFSNSVSNLTVCNSPYYVVSDVTIQSNAILNVENGVEIIFTNGYTITARGNINTCNDSGIDTTYSNTRGLADTTEYTYIHSNGNGRNGSFVFDYDTSDVDIKFCNVLFEGLQYCGDYESTSSITGYYDNCEFSNIDYPIVSYWFNHDITVTDSYFHDFTTNQGDNIQFDNCLFEDFVDSVISNNFFSHTAYVYNSTIIDTLGTASYCIASERGGETVYNNSISNCSIGIYVENFDGSIMSNIITDNDIGIKITDISSSSDGNINLNYFNNNGINIALDDIYDFNNGANNYWGVSSSNASIIGATIYDICDSYSDGLFTFWPWISSVYRDDDDSYKTITYNIDFSDCSSYYASSTMSQLNGTLTNDIIKLIIDESTNTTTAATTTTINITLKTTEMNNNGTSIETSMTTTEDDNDSDSQDIGVNIYQFNAIEKLLCIILIVITISCYN